MSLQKVDYYIMFVFALVRSRCKWAILITHKKTWDWLDALSYVRSRWGPNGKFQPTTCFGQGDASVRFDMFFSAEPG